MYEQINIPTSPKVKKSFFVGSPEYNYKAMKYLQQKYNDACVIIPNVKKSSIDSHEDVSLRWVQTQKRISVPKGFWELFHKCNDKRFIIFPFGFSCKDTGHANIMIYDKRTKSLERFETYGKSTSVCSNPPNLDKKIEALFKQNLGEEFVLNYYKPIDYLPKCSFQCLQEKANNMGKNDAPNGYCSIWSVFYAELRLQNPNKDRKRLVMLALKKLKDRNESLTEFIRNYSQSIVENTKHI